MERKRPTLRQAKAYQSLLRVLRKARITKQVNDQEQSLFDEMNKLENEGQ